jgi:hypothetical protein
LEKTPNDKFRDARERTQSPAHPDECLSRQEVADRANAWIWEHHGKKYDLNKNYVGKIEQGVIRWPDAVRRAAFRALFKVPKDSELGFVNARARSRRAVVKLDDVKRRHLIENTALGVGALALGEAVAALLEALGISEPPPIPRRVGVTDIEHIRSATQVFGSWSSTYGGGLIRDTAMAHLRRSARLLKEAICPEQLRPELFSAVGYLAATAGYLAEDTGAPAQARRVYGFALYCVEQAKEWNLRAEVLSSMAKLEMRAGQPDEGLTLAELALVRADRLTPTYRTLLHTDRSRTLAKMHRVQESLRAIGTADEHFTDATNDPPSFYTAARHNQLTGATLADLAMLGRDPGEATHRLTAAAADHAAGQVRSRALCLAKLASLTMATGDPLQAAAIGHQALEVTDSIHSYRAAEELRDLSRYAAAHQRLEEVEHLRQRIATLVGTENPGEEPSLDPSSIHP